MWPPKASKNNSASASRPACPLAQQETAPTHLETPRPCLSPPLLLYQPQAEIPGTQHVHRMRPQVSFHRWTSLLPNLAKEKTFSHRLPSSLALMAMEGEGDVVGSLGTGDQCFYLACPPRFCPVGHLVASAVLCFHPPPALPVHLHPCPPPTQSCPAASQQPAHLEDSAGHLSPSLGSRAESTWFRGSWRVSLLSAHQSGSWEG